MNEKYPHPQHNSGEQSPEEQSPPVLDELETGPATSIESDSDDDWELRWEISDVILTAVYNLVEHPGPEARDTVFALAGRLVEHVYGANPTSDQHQQALAMLTTTVNDRIIALAEAHDDLTTSDLQSGVGALAFMLVRQQLPVGETKPIEGGEDE